MIKILDDLYLEMDGSVYKYRYEENALWLEQGDFEIPFFEDTEIYKNIKLALIKYERKNKLNKISGGI